MFEKLNKIYPSTTKKFKILFLNQSADTKSRNLSHQHDNVTWKNIGSVSSIEENARKISEMSKCSSSPHTSSRDLSCGVHQSKLTQAVNGCGSCSDKLCRHRILLKV